MYQELTVAYLPDHSVSVEWQETEEPLNKAQELLQNELYKRYNEDFMSP